MRVTLIHQSIRGTNLTVIKLPRESGVKEPLIVWILTLLNPN